MKPFSKFSIIFLIGFSFNILYGQTQKDNFWSCDFSPNQWKTDSIGETGYRHFIISNLACNSVDSLINVFENLEDLMMTMGRPNSFGSRKNGGVIFNYQIFQKVDEEVFLYREINFYLDIKGLIEFHFLINY